MTQFIPSGDSAFIVRFSNEISIETHKKVRSYIIALSEKNVNGVLELVPSYTDVLVNYDPTVILYPELAKILEDLDENLGEIILPAPRKIEIPVFYGESFGPDLKAVAKHNNLSEEEVIKIHSEGEYLVYMLGFTPGFCYLGGMDSKIATPRKEVPNKKVAEGSIGIAKEQTGIYPIESPGGWQIIGRTPLKLFQVNNENPFLLKSGDVVRFKKVDEDEFRKIESEVWDGKYQIKTY